jgi:hypothetical protein
MPPKPKNGLLGVFVGSSRQGKTVSVKHDIRRRKWRRIIVWSVKERVDKYGEMPLGLPVFYPRTIPELTALVRRVGKGEALIVYTPQSMKDFDAWCRVAFAWGLMKRCAIVAEELADVTTPAKAPEGWGRICRQILGYGCDVYAITQRPAESDKTCFGNRSYIVIHRMVRAQDRAYLALETDIPRPVIDGIEHDSLCWLRQDGGKVTPGQHVFR